MQLDTELARPCSSKKRSARAQRAIIAHDGGCACLGDDATTLGLWPPIHQTFCLLSADPPSNPLCHNPFRRPLLHTSTSLVELGRTWYTPQDTFALLLLSFLLLLSLSCSLLLTDCIFFCTCVVVYLCNCVLYVFSPPAVCCLALCLSLIEGRPRTRWCWSAFHLSYPSIHQNLLYVPVHAPYFFDFVNCISHAPKTFPKSTYMKLIVAWDEMLVGWLFIFLI